MVALPVMSPREQDVCLHPVSGCHTTISTHRDIDRDIPMYSRTVPSSFSSTMWSSKTLSYRVCGGFTADGMVDVGGFELWRIWEVLGGVIRGIKGADAS